MELTINVKNLTKVYQTFEQQQGLGGSMKDFFKRKYKNIVALDKVSFEIQQGEIVGLIGPNGAGKSTTLKILSGILFPSSGQANVNVDGKSYVPWQERTQYVKKIGVVFGQKSQLWFDLPPMDTFSLHKTLYDISDKDFKKRLDRYVELLDIKDIIHRPTRQLSLGERMKCELVVALLHAPTLVFLDEPTIGLDIIVKEKIRQFIQEINQRDKITFILTTHDLQDIDKLCKRVMILDGGKMVYDGLLEKLKTNFIKEKRIQATFKEPLKSSFSVAGAKIESKDKFEATLRVPLAKVNEVTKKLLDMDLIDINITEPTIEQVISHIYRKK